MDTSCPLDVPDGTNVGINVDTMICCISNLPQIFRCFNSLFGKVIAWPELIQLLTYA